MKHRLSKKERANLARILIALLAFIPIFAVDKSIGLASSIGGTYGWLLPFGLYLAVYLTIGFDIVYRAVRNIFHGQIFDENLLMCVASLGAFALAIFRGVNGLDTEGFDEACAVMIFYQIGEFFQRYAVGKSRSSIQSILDIRPDSANLKTESGVTSVFPDEVEIGQIIIVYPGERVPLDGICVSGATSLDVSALTGESVPKEIAVGDEALSGSVNISSTIELEVQKQYYDSTASKILELVEKASDKKSKTENFITKFARYYTPTVVIIALILAVIPGAVTGDWSIWVYRALSFLVVSCPCALVISIPLGFFSGIGAASKYGILVKGSDYLEKYAKANSFVFDKTGTLTKGNFEVVEVYPHQNAEEVLRLASIAENGSSHPIAQSILRKYDKKTDASYTLTNEPGMGIVAKKDDDVILCGNRKLMESYGISVPDADIIGTVIFVAHNCDYVGYAVIRDELKPDAAEIVAELKSSGARTVMLTGDGEATANDIATRVGVDEYKACLLPADKVNEVERLLAEKNSNQTLCFVGDGINDAPVLMRSDIGVAMGCLGSDAAIEAADIVLMRDELNGLTTARRIAKKTMRIVRENIIFSLGVKLAILILSAIGMASMWMAVFGDVGVAIIAILNAIRINGKYKTVQKYALDQK